MADRFPSLEDFDVGETDTQRDPSAEPSTDDFLAREKALLGEDAHQFATSQDADLLGGGGEDILGLSAGHAQEPTFESQFPEIGPDSGPGSGSGDMTTATGPSIIYNSGYRLDPGSQEEESDVVKQWRERRDAAVAKRAAQFAAQREETVNEARQNIDDFYENYNGKKDKLIAQTRKEAEEFIAGRDSTVSGGTSWDRIAKLIDVSGKGAKGGAAGSGKERFRELLMSLKKDEKAPGATGY